MTAVRLLVSVVDDDESIRESLPDLLNELGYSPLAFSSAREFLASGAVNQTSVLLLDISMPGMNGIELLEELRRHGDQVPVVFITANRDEALSARVIEQGAVACLKKPFSDTDLLDALEAALKIK